MNKNILLKRPQINPLKNGYRECRILGFDTETYINDFNYCVANTLQFTGDDFDSEIIFVDNDSVLSEFMATVDLWAKDKENNVLVSHNLLYDICTLFLGYEGTWEKLAEGYLRVEWSNASLQIWNNKICFGLITFGKTRRVKLIDTLRFTFTSLDNSAKIFGLDFGKEESPEELGKRRFNENDSVFSRYAIRDSIIVYQIGKHIAKWHKHFDTPLCISGAQLSSRVFRRNYLDKPFTNASLEHEDYFIKSFHGGLTRAVSGFYPELKEYDINSAYPFAMTQLGIPSKFRYVGDYIGENAIYRVQGYCADRKLPILFDSAFKPQLDEGITFVTGYELASALEKNEFIGKIIDGVSIEFDSSDCLQRFVSNFWTEKENAKRQGQNDKAFMYKIILNSLYGKMIQTTPFENGWKAGGLWNPALATLITGSVRARIHNLEHDNNSVHSATDAIKTKNTLQTEKKLGSLGLSCEGDCLIVRGKLYAHYNKPDHSFKIATHGLGIKNVKVALSQALTQGFTTKKRLVTPKTGRVRGLPLLSWVDIKTQILNEIPAFPEEFKLRLLEYCNS